MQHAGHFTAALFALLLSFSSFAAAENACLQCHATQSTGYSKGHSFAPDNCTSCHAGDASATALADAHAGMSAFPGNLSNAERACGSCHGDKVSSVKSSLMHTGHGMVSTTRRLVDGAMGHSVDMSLQSLGHGPADSMMRKLCASCHLGQEKTIHQLDPLSDRGGGCLACHINDYPESAHPALTRQVSDGRCFGCHSRSGRISLSYTGLAEVLTEGAERPLRLADGRTVERMPADVHYQAGMGCIDCHTAVGLMGDNSDSQPQHQREAVDISCGDCHLDSSALRTADNFSTANHSTVLTHLEKRDDELWLHSKTSGRSLQIPLLDEQHALHSNEHERLECVTCHSQWAPRCFGCHMTYDAKGEQWDHVEKKLTPGRWIEQRDNIENALATLGVNAENRIELFIPGMIMSLKHPDWEQEKFTRVFAPLSPHTTGAARSCESCHRSATALGLGEGLIEHTEGNIRFTPHQRILRDGLPLDAWTDTLGQRGGATPLKGQRPLSPVEMKAILLAPLTVDAESN